MKKKSGRVPDAHLLVRGAVDGWFVCSCGCGYVAVCSHCVPGLAQSIPTCLCDAEQRRLRVGRYAPVDSDGRRVIPWG